MSPHNKILRVSEKADHKLQFQAVPGESIPEQDICVRIFQEEMPHQSVQIPRYR